MTQSIPVMSLSLDVLNQLGGQRSLVMIERVEVLKYVRVF